MATAAAGRQSPEIDRPNMSDLRIVLIGKNGSENSRVANTILGRAAFHSKAPSHSQHLSVRISVKVEERYVTVINTHLLQPNLPHQQITQGVRECVSLSAPGPHVFVLVLQYRNFTEDDKLSMKYVLKLFSYQAMKHTVVVTTDEETRGYKYIPKNVCINAIHNLIHECGGPHLKFDTSNPGWRSQLFRGIEKVLKEEHEDFLICNMYDDAGGTSVDENLSRFLGADREDNEKEIENSDLKESTKTGGNGGGLSKSFSQDNSFKM